MMNIKNITKAYTLFIDRDGVINHEKRNDYIRNWEEFSFYEDTLEAFKILSNIFGCIILVTNQKGVGKGLMSKKDLSTIHSNMLQQIKQAGGRIDAIYFCTDLDDNSPNRKPNAGMAFQAKNDFPLINFDKSFMVGNRLSDMFFARNAGIKHSVYLNTTHPDTPTPHPAIDFRYNTLLNFAQALTKS